MIHHIIIKLSCFLIDLGNDLRIVGYQFICLPYNIAMNLLTHTLLPSLLTISQLAVSYKSSLNFELLYFTYC